MPRVWNHEAVIDQATLNMAKDTTGRLHVQVKTGGKRKLSSKLWLERQLNDPYVAKARREGYRSRAAFKLVEIDDKYRLLKPGMTVVDLGAAPGGWSQIAAKRVGAPEKGKVIAIDLLEMGEIVGVTFAQMDFLDADAPDKLIARCLFQSSSVVLARVALSAMPALFTRMLMSLSKYARTFSNRLATLAESETSQTDACACISY